MGNLLNRNESFVWTDPRINRESALINFHKAIVEARNLEDQIFITPDIYDPNKQFFQFFLFLWSNDHEGFRERYSWVTPDLFQVLIQFTNLLGNQTPSKSSTFIDFQNEFHNENNSWIGTYEFSFSEPLVYDVFSLEKFHHDWDRLHQAVVFNYTFEEQCNNFYYFKKFYKPTLKIAANQINDQIRNGRTHTSIIRLDIPLVANEKIHIHFPPVKDKKCALNIDGTWKHEVDGFNISREACEILSSWGFLLPDKYYQ